MQYLGVIAFILCVVHYIYQAVILPSYRQAARDRLFVLRDTLRAQYINVQHTENKTTLRAFKEVDDVINRSLNRLHLLTFSNFVRAMLDAKHNNVEYEESLRRFHALLDNSHDKTPGLIVKDVNNVLRDVFMVNTIMMSLYLLPFIIVVKLVGVIYDKVKRRTNEMLEFCMVAKPSAINGSLFNDKSRIAM
jgi:hypothetical protein